MKTKTSQKGFTLIELMIVIAIIAIIAAIAIPGLLAAQRSANQRNASASLKTIPTAEADFRSNDRDGDRQNNYWVLDLYGMYGIIPSTDGTTAPASLAANAGGMIKVIESGIASSDGGVYAAAIPGIVSPTVALSTVRSPKSSYLFVMATTDELNIPYAETPGAAYLTGFHNFGKFATLAVPVARGGGTQMYLVTEDSTIYRFELPATYAATFNTAWTAAGLTGIMNFTTGTAGHTWCTTLAGPIPLPQISAVTIQQAGGAKMD